jgi:hypothetical protein
MAPQSKTSLFLLGISLQLLLIGCSAIPISTELGDPPPVLSQDELLRPYSTLGRITIVREVYFTDYAMEPNLQQWGQQALQTEAAKMGADAVILPEITSRAITIVLFPAFPASEYRASGVAIKFK